MTVAGYAARGRSRTTRGDRVTRFVVGLTVAAAMVAVAPIVAAMFGIGTGGSPRSAFATAPAGTYAVVTRTEGAVDMVAAVRADGTGEPIELARVPHLAGFPTTGSVSPDGGYAAVVAVDGGTPTTPSASLIVVELTTGRVERLISGIEPSQVPAWDPASGSVAVTRQAPGADGAPAFDVLRVARDGSVTRLWSQRDALGVYPLGWRGAELLAVVIDGRGSTLQANGQDLAHLSEWVTRDWTLSPGGDAVAFVEANLSEGLRYLPRVVMFGGDATATAQALAAPGFAALGTAWGRGSGPAFGAVPAGGGGSDASAQALSASGGFEVPLGYSPDGSVLAVTRWDGSSFDAPGRPQLELVSPQGRTAVPGYRGFLGWAQR